MALSFPSCWPNPRANVRRPFVTARAAAFAGFALALSAQAASPTLSHLVPGGGQRGTEVEVICEGARLDDAKGLLFYERGLEVTGVSEAAGGKFKAKIKIAPDAALGEHSVRVWTATGVGDLRTFYVSPYPLVKEAEEAKEGTKKDEPQAVASGSTVWGQIQGEDVDRFVVEAKKGQRISAEVVGVRLQPREIFDSMLTLTKADGTVLAESDDSSLLQQDPVISFVAPEDGKYILALKDSTNAAPGAGRYLLHVGSFPRPLTVYPAGGQIGEQLKVTYLGDAAGPLSATLKLPAQPDTRFPAFPDQNGQVAPSPNWLRVSPFPNVLEAEPNNEAASATPTDKPLPLAFNGVIGEKGDVDFFKFTAKKGDEFDVNVFARRLRSPLDALLEIHDEKGNRIAQNDDAGGPDSYLSWKVPNDGSYCVAVKDQLGRGGPVFTYRIELTPKKPEVAVWLPEMQQNTQERQTISVPKGNRYASLVKIKRDNFGGDVTLAPSELPAGVAMSAGPVLGNVDTIAVVFEAAATAPVATRTFALNAKSTEGKPLESRVAHPINIVDNGNNAPYYRITEDKLAVAVAEEAPFKIQLVEPKVPIAQSGSMNLRVVAERKPEFKGKINLALLYSPPGIGTAGSAEIKEGATEGLVPISATGDAQMKKWKVTVVGSADTGKGAVWVSTQLADLEVSPPFVGGQIVRTFVDQGDKTVVTVKLQQKTPFEGKAKIQLLGLPNKVTAADREITKDDTEVKFEVLADKSSPVARHGSLFCQVAVPQNGETILQSFAQGGILRIDPASVAKAEVKEEKK
jgi:Bacterial pre-peptidase C-terminal domain